MGDLGGAATRDRVGGRILVVDDEAAVRKLVEMALTRAGYLVRSAADAAQAMALCESETFDLLLSDVRMPGMNGHALAQWVAARSPDTRTALMTAYDVECPGCPFSPRCRILAKPFLPRDLVAFVAGVLTANS
jgi:DNA-binding NtrC family response regulator